MVKKNKDKLPRARPIITYEKPESPKPLFNSPEITRSTTNIVTRISTNFPDDTLSEATKGLRHLLNSVRFFDTRSGSTIEIKFK
jgi:hypothetical protein